MWASLGRECSKPSGALWRYYPFDQLLEKDESIPEGFFALNIMINLKKLPKNLGTKERFDSSYSPEALTGCWLWNGSQQGSNGYGRLKVDGKPQMAHRVSYRLFKGEIPDGYVVMHSCDTPLCVNPSHLSVGTPQNNENDKKRKGRQAKGKSLSLAQENYLKRGEKSKSHKLKEHQVNEIKQMTIPQRQIAKIFGVTQATISLIKTGKTWNTQI